MVSMVLSARGASKTRRVRRSKADGRRRNKEQGDEGEKYCAPRETREGEDYRRRKTILTSVHQRGFDATTGQISPERDTGHGTLSDGFLRPGWNCQRCREEVLDRRGAHRILHALHILVRAVLRQVSLNVSA
jgi:hypothetical protein